MILFFHNFQSFDFTMEPFFHQFFVRCPSVKTVSASAMKRLLNLTYEPVLHQHIAENFKINVILSFGGFEIYITECM